MSDQKSSDISPNRAQSISLPSRPTENGGGGDASRIAVVSILVCDRKVSEKINAILSDYGEYILGRMGLPYRAKGIFVLSVVLDAPVEVTNALTGKIGKIHSVSVKALFGKR